MFFLQFCVRRCSEICSLCTWRKKGIQENSSKKPQGFLCCFNVRVPAGVAARTAREDQKENKNTNKNIQRLSFSRPQAKLPKKGRPGAQEAPRKPPAKHLDPSEVDFGHSGAHNLAQAQAQSASAGPRAKDSRQQGRKASRTRGPGGMCGAPSSFDYSIGQLHRL